MFTLYQKAFAPPRKLYRIGLLFTHKNGCGGAISVTERGSTATISKVESDMLDTCSCSHTMPDSFSWRREKLSAVM